VLQTCSLRGRWVGTSYDGAIISGCAAMAPTEAEARQLIESLTSDTP